MGLKSMLDEMNKNRPQAGEHFNALNPTGGSPRGNAYAAATCNAQARGLVSREAILLDLERNRAQIEMAAAHGVLAREATARADAVRGRMAGFADRVAKQMASRPGLTSRETADALAIDRGFSVTSETLAEQRRLACDRMGETRCSTRCYTACRHVEPEPKKARYGRYGAKDQVGWVAKLPNTMARDIPLVEIEGVGRVMSACSALPDPPSRGYGKVEHENAHLRPRWR